MKAYVVRVSLGGRLQWPSQTFPDHARLPPTVFTTTERPPNDLWRPLNVHTRPTFRPIPDHSRLFWTVQNSREHLDWVHRPLRTFLTRSATALSRPPTDFTRPPDHLGRDRSASKSAINVTIALDKSRRSQVATRIQTLMHSQGGSTNSRLSPCHE